MSDLALGLLFVLPAVFLGSATQRITGVGFAQVAAPFLVIAYGPFSGVLVVNLIAVVSAAIVIARLWRDIEWRQFFGLALPAALGIPAGAWLASNLPSAPLEVLVGVLLLASLIVSLFAGRISKVTRHGGLRSAAGFLGGAMSASVGVGGPALTVYAVLTRWEHRGFRATVQPFFLTTGAASFLTKFFFAPERFAQLDWWTWLAMGLALVLGLVAGDFAARRISAPIARVAVIAIAFAGALTAVGRGTVELLGG